MRGVLLVPAERMTEPDKLIRLWIHEVYRVFNDRLTDDNDRFVNYKSQLIIINGGHSLMAFFQDNLFKPVPELGTILDFAEAEMMGWQWHRVEWHQPDHMQVICTSLQRDNHAITSSSFLKAIDYLLLNRN